MKAFEIGARKTVVFYLHGLRGHAFAHKASLEHMVKNLGVSLVSLELPGHGEDAFLEHCMVPRYHQLVSMIVDEVRRLAGGSEQVILMGYSFGGALMTIAANELQKDEKFSPKVAGFIGISTAYDVAHNVPKWQLILAGTIAPISRFLFRHRPKWSRYVTIREMDVTLITPSVCLQASMLDDDLVYKGRIPLNTSAQVYKASLTAKKLVNQLTTPILLLHSVDDAIALAPTENTFEPHVRLRLFKNLRHNCIDGLAREAVLSRRAITHFISEKL